nr:uncharacterized protein LOC105321919 [Crassostrea gigas]
MMTTHWILGLLVLGVAKSEGQISKTITLTDDICGGSYFFLKKDHYLVWDGSHIGRDSLLNIWDGFDVKKDSGSCKVDFHPAIGYTVCVTVERFHIEDCNASVNYYHDGDSEIKATYGCNTTPGSFCGTGTGESVEVEIAYKRKSPPGSSNYFTLKISLYYRSLLFLIILLPPLVVIIITLIIVAVRRRTKSKCLAFRKSNTTHSRLVNEPTEPNQPNLGCNSAYPMNEPATRDFTVTVPVVVNVR